MEGAINPEKILIELQILRDKGEIVFFLIKYA